jgi:hypothetical protein
MNQRPMNQLSMIRLSMNQGSNPRSRNQVLKLAKFAVIIVLCLGSLGAGASSDQLSQKKKTKKPQLPTLPSGPTGKQLQPVPLDSIATVAPQVEYERGQLTIIANNSTLAEVLKAVHKQTGAEIEIPTATDRVVTRLGPGPAREVVAELLNGSRFNYVLLGSPEDPSTLTRVVLVAKSAVDPGSLNNNMGQPPPAQAHNAVPPALAAAADANDAEAPPEENADEAAEQPPADGEQPGAPADQPGVKTPQQLLQEMQQRQLQLQQQQQGQPPIPGAAVSPQQTPQQPPPQEQN